MSNFYSEEELNKIKFLHLGKNVLISKKSSIYGAQNISIDDNVRIDDFCILSGKISIGKHVHIGAYSALFGGEYGIKMDDFSGVSSRVTIYANSDDYSGDYLTNPTVNKKYTNVSGKQVMLGKHVIIGTGTVILPGVEIGNYSAIGALSLVIQRIEEKTIATGIPAVAIKKRRTKLIELEKIFLEEKKHGKI